MQVNLYGLALVITRIYAILEISVSARYLLSWIGTEIFTDRSFQFLPRLHEYSTEQFLAAAVHAVFGLTLLVFSRNIARFASDTKGL